LFWAAWVFTGFLRLSIKTGSHPVKKHKIFFQKIFGLWIKKEKAPAAAGAFLKT
jgi:hypothetical protein